MALRLVLDTNVLVAAMRSRTGASHALLEALEYGHFRAVATVTLLFEYEEVLSRPVHLDTIGLTAGDMADYVDALASRIERIERHFSWRPQLADAADEMVLEAAVNGRADAVVTFNTRHLAPIARFGIELWTPAETMKGIRRGSR